VNALNTFLFVAFPYVAVAVFAAGIVYRYRKTGFTVSSLSSQFLEARKLFWGSVPFHFGLLVVFLGHLVAFLLPDAVLAWNRQPMRLIVLEMTGFIFGLSVLVGLVALVLRRITDSRVRRVTTRMDIAIELLLLAQVVLGCWVALGFRWGSSWFATNLTPYLVSMVKLQPETNAIFALPWVVKLHVLGGFLIAFLIPFTRLAHFLVAPLHYISRPYQRVVWNWDPRAIRRRDRA
jgi:nitrate reductase gamma subunit